MADTLVAELRARDHEAELVTVPFKWYPGTRVLDQAFLWRLLDLTEIDGRPIDLVLATKFPSYVVRHPNKRVWVLHQFRQAYGSTEPIWASSPKKPWTGRCGARSKPGPDRARRGEAALRHLAQRRRPDRALHGSRGRGAAAPAAGAALPQRRLRRLRPLGRALDRAKRNDLLLEAAALDPGLRVVIAGEGPDRDRLEALAAERGLNGRASSPAASTRPSSPPSTPTAWPSTTRRSTRTSGWSPTRRSSPRSRC